MKKFVFGLFCLIICSSYINAAGYQGCCSHHGGINYCSTTGRIVCNDGTYSPSCRCDDYNYGNNYNYKSLNYNNNSASGSYDDETEFNFGNFIINIIAFGYFGSIAYFLVKK